MLHITQLTLHGTAVSTVGRSAPGRHGPISKDGCKSARSGLHALHIPQLILHDTAVATVRGTSLGHHGSLSKDGCKSFRTALNVLHVPQLSLHGTAVASAASPAPGHNEPISKGGRKSARGGLCCTFCTALPLPPSLTSPQVTTDPSTKWLQKREKWLACAAHSSADLARHGCRHRTRHFPRSPRIPQQGWLQKREKWLACAAHSSADLARHGCRHRTRHFPRSPRIPQQGWLQKREKWLACAAHSSADLDTAVATVRGTSLGHHGSLSKDGCKSFRTALNVLHVPQLSLHGTAVASVASPAQVTTNPSARVAAKAQEVACAAHFARHCRCHRR